MGRVLILVWMIVWSAQNAFADEMLEADKREYTKKKIITLGIDQ